MKTFPYELIFSSPSTKDKEKYLPLGYSQTCSTFLANRYGNPKTLDGLLFNIQDLDFSEERGKLSYFLDSPLKEIGICCDYDVDGISSCAQIIAAYDYNFKYYIPDRYNEGHGFNKRIVDEAINDGIKRLLCLDLGTSNTEAINYANERGLQIFIVDHHTASRCATSRIINPNLAPGCPAKSNMCTAGLIYYCLGKLATPECLQYATLGTICDMAPLIGVNRTLVKKGLDILSKPEEKEGCFLAYDNITDTTLAFQIGPAINAISRMGKVKELDPVQFVLGYFGPEILTKISDNNMSRYLIGQGVLRQADIELDSVDSNAICLYLPNVLSGVLGIIAQKLTQRYLKPCFLFTNKDDEYLVGSGRTFDDKKFPLINFLQSLNFDYKYGGHTGAAGLTLKKKDFLDFQKDFNAYCHQYFYSKYPVYVDLELKTADISKLDELKKLEPFGRGFDKPLIGIKKLKVDRHPGGIFLKSDIFNIWADSRDFTFIEHGDIVNIAGHIGSEKFNVRYIEKIS